MGEIVETGRISGSAKRTVNADGLAVSPGFIDFHTHLDAQLLWDPLATSSCYHGVTTVIPGNCGLSLAPCKEPDRDTILRSFERVEAITFPALKAGVTWGFTTFGQYLDTMRGNLGVNVASLVGHCALAPVRHGRRLHRARRDAGRDPSDEGSFESQRARGRRGFLDQSESRAHVRRRHADPESLRHRRRNYRAGLRASARSIRARSKSRAARWACRCPCARA